MKGLGPLPRTRGSALALGCGRGGRVVLPLPRAAAVSTGLRVRQPRAAPASVRLQEPRRLLALGGPGDRTRRHVRLGARHGRRIFAVVPAQLSCLIIVACLHVKFDPLPPRLFVAGIPVRKTCLASAPNRLDLERGLFLLGHGRLRLSMGWLLAAAPGASQGNRGCKQRTLRNPFPR